MSFLLTIGPVVAIYIMLAVSLGLLIGHAGVFSIAHAGIYGVGAYTFAILSVTYGWGFVPSMLAVVVVTGVVSALTAIPSLRVFGDYFIVASLTMQTVILDSINGAAGLTGGPGGFPGVARPRVFGIDFDSDERFFLLTAGFAVIAVLMVTRVVRSPFGRALRAVRDDEGAAVSIGKSPSFYKLVVTILAGVIAGIAGVLHAQQLMFVSPASFGLETSINIIAMVVIGGMTSIAGAIVGASLVALLPQVLQEFDLPDVAAGPIQQIVFGMVLIAVMFWRPHGILGKQTDLPPAHG